MPRIEPVPREAIADAELRELIERCERLGVPDALFPQILARVPEYAKAILRALLMSHERGNVDHKLKEIVRVQLARFAGDRYFSALRSKRAREAGLDEATIDAGSGDYDDDPRFTESEKLALRYSDQMYLDPAKVDAAFYNELKKHYSEAQIMELGAFIALHYGMQLFMRTLDASPLVTEKANDAR